MTGYKQPILPCYSTLTALKIFLWLYKFPIEKATRYTSEIASKEPNVCKKNYIARELMLEINKFTESVNALPFCEHFAENCRAVSSIGGR